MRWKTAGCWPSPSHPSHSNIHPVLTSGLELQVFTCSFPLLYLGFPSPLGCSNKTSLIMI